MFSIFIKEAWQHKNPPENPSPPLAFLVFRLYRLNAIAAYPRAIRALGRFINIKIEGWFEDELVLVSISDWVHTNLTRETSNHNRFVGSGVPMNIYICVRTLPMCMCCVFVADLASHCVHVVMGENLKSSVGIGLQRDHQVEKWGASLASGRGPPLACC